MTAVEARGARGAAGTRGGSGLALGILSAATFGTSGVFATSLIKAGWSPAAAVTARVAASALVLTVPALLQLRGRWALLRRRAATVAAFGLVAVAGCQLFYFNAIQRMPVGVALLLEYLGTILVVGWLWLRHDQRPRRRTVLGAIAAMTGLVLVLNLTGSTRLDPIGVMWGLLAAAGLAIYFMLSSATDAEPLPPIVMAWAGMCVGAAMLAALGAIGVLSLTATAADVSFVGHKVSWIVPVLGLSIIASVIAYVAGIGAARRLGPKLASFTGLAEVLFAVLLAWLLLNQLPSGIQLLGGAFIITGVALVRVDELRGAPGPAGQPDDAAGAAQTERVLARDKPGRFTRPEELPAYGELQPDRVDKLRPDRVDELRDLMLSD